MEARVVVEAEALERLGELGLTVEIIERAIRRAEAEAATCTALDPPIMAGLIRYGRTVRFLREDLVPMGWDFDDPRNFSRTIHPSRQFALVASSGDDATGNATLTPTTKYAKGYATACAVDTNGQLAFDFGDLGNETELSDNEQLATWFLLYHVTGDEIRAEVSLPSAMAGGKISDWLERIILPSFPRHEEPLADTAGRDDGPDEYVVEVNRR